MKRLFRNVHICVKFWSRELYLCLSSGPVFLLLERGWGRGPVLEKENDLHKAEAFTVLEGRWSVIHRVCGARRPSVPEKAGCPGCRLLAGHRLLGKARFSQPSGAGRPPTSPSTYALFFETALWSYNSRAIPFILSKCPIQWFLGVYRIVQPSPYSHFRTFSSPKKRDPVPVSGPSYSFLPSAPADLQPASRLYVFAYLDVLHKWNHTTSVLL